MGPEEIARLITEDPDVSEGPISSYLAPDTWEQPIKINDEYIIGQIEELSGEKYTDEYGWGTEGLALMLTGDKVAKLWVGPRAIEHIWERIYKMGGKVPHVNRVYNHGNIDLGFELDGRTKYAVTIMDRLKDTYPFHDLFRPPGIEQTENMLGIKISTAEVGTNKEGNRVIYDFD